MKVRSACGLLPCTPQPLLARSLYSLPLDSFRFSQSASKATSRLFDASLVRQTCSRIAARSASWPAWTKQANTTSCPLIWTTASASSLRCRPSVPSAIRTAATVSTPLPTATTPPAQCLPKATTTATTSAVAITRTAATLAKVRCRRPPIRTTTEFRQRSEPPMRRSASGCSTFPSRRATARPATTTTCGSASKTIPNAVTSPPVCRLPVLPARRSTATTTTRRSTPQSARLLRPFIRWWPNIKTSRAATAAPIPSWRFLAAPAAHPTDRNGRSRKWLRRWWRNADWPPTLASADGWTTWTARSTGSATSCPLWATTDNSPSTKRSKWLRVTSRHCGNCFSKARRRVFNDDYYCTLLPFPIQTVTSLKKPKDGSTTHSSYAR